MPDPNFIRQAVTDPIFYLDMSGSGAESCAVAFLPNGDPGTLPLILPLSATWVIHPGIYIVLRSPVADQNAFVANVRQFIGITPTRFLWISNPADPINTWQTMRLLALQQHVDSNATFDFHGYALAIDGGCPITLNDGIFTIPPAAPGSIRFMCGEFGFLSPVDGPARLPLTGPSTGCILFALTLRKETPGTISDIRKIDATLAYFVDDPDWPGLLKILRYPVLNLTRGDVTLQASLDPNNPLLPARTRFAFLETPSSPGIPIASGFRTVYGEEVLLRPCSSQYAPLGPALVFSIRPEATTPGPSAPYYLTFAGSFAMTTETSLGGALGSVPSGRIICGISGLEYAGLQGGFGTMLVHFFPDQPAYAPDLLTRSDADATSDVTNKPLLTGLARTAWAGLSPSDGGELCYFAQPRDAVIYHPESDPTGTLDENMLYYLEVFAGAFPATVPPPGPPPLPATPAAFPMVPYGNVDTVSNTLLSLLEVRVLSPTRRFHLDQILEQPPPEPGVGTHLGTTPQGLLITFDETIRQWQQITLARNNDGAQTLALRNIRGGFKKAMQSEQLFAVISNPDQFKACCDVPEEFELTIDDWHFKLSPDTWGEHNTLVLIKYAAGTVEELASDTSLWSWQAAATGYSGTEGTISGNIETTQADLLAIIADARRRGGNGEGSDGDPDFRRFYRDVLSNPAWTGILFLRVALSTSSFPPQLQGLAAGIDNTMFYAHHIGVNVTPTHTINHQLVQGDSSIFGMIYYDDPVDLNFTDADYAYKVLSLKLLIENSTIRDFASRIELLIARAFGTSVTPSGGTHGGNLVLNGVYQQRENGDRAYLFTQEEPLKLGLAGSVLETIVYTQAQFNTLLQPDGAWLGGMVRTQFTLGGTMAFAEHADFDLFSFGPQGELQEGAATPPRGLVFSNLLITMSFDVSEPTNTEFSTDISALTFDLSRSIARDNSLYNLFPLTLTGFIDGPIAATPESLGYAPVRSPLSISALTTPWYALAFDLDLGTLGALAGGIGLVVSIVAAWSPGQYAPSIYCGINVPGASSNHPLLSLQGIINLSFKSVEIMRSRSEGGLRTEYMMKFRRIVLNVLSMSLPPGPLDLYLFGDPSGGRSGVVGWYAAYASEE